VTSTEFPGCRLCRADVLGDPRVPPSVHACLEADPGGARRASPRRLRVRINHYTSKSEAEWREKVARGRATTGVRLEARL